MVASERAYAAAGGSLKIHCRAIDNAGAGSEAQCLQRYASLKAALTRLLWKGCWHGNAVGTSQKANSRKIYIVFGLMPKQGIMADVTEPLKGCNTGRKIG